MASARQVQHARAKPNECPNCFLLAISNVMNLSSCILYSMSFKNDGFYVPNLDVKRWDGLVGKSNILIMGLC
jgi:hypothetical protein